MKARELRSVNAQDYFTSEEAAQELGIKPTAIRNYLSKGQLTTYKFKTLTLIAAREVQSWNGRKRKR